MDQKRIKIGVDADCGTKSIIEGVNLFMDRSNYRKTSEICLIGCGAGIKPFLAHAHLKGLAIIPASETVSMKDSPLAAIKKTDSSILIGAAKVKDRSLDAFCSTGNTGAVMVAASKITGKVPGVQRAGIYALVPQVEGPPICLLDVGANQTVKSIDLVEFAIQGSVYMQAVHGIEEPGVALLNVGEEPSKGGEPYVSAYELLAKDPRIRFLGNCEGDDIMTAYKKGIQVIVTDGRTGNVLIKHIEGMFDVLVRKGIKDAYIQSLNYELYGGAVYLGIDGVIVTGHGKSTPLAIMNMIETAVRAYEADINNRISIKIQQQS